MSAELKTAVFKQLSKLCLFWSVLRSPGRPLDHRFAQCASLAAALATSSPPTLTNEHGAAQTVGVSRACLFLASLPPQPGSPKTLTIPFPSPPEALWPDSTARVKSAALGASSDLRAGTPPPSPPFCPSPLAQLLPNQPFLWKDKTLFSVPVSPSPEFAFPFIPD